MGIKIAIGLLIGFLSTYILDNYRGRKEAKREGVVPEGTRWWLVLVSIVPGFVLGAVFAVILEKTGMSEDIEAFSPGFYILISLGSTLSYLALNKIFPRKSNPS